MAALSLEIETNVSELPYEKRFPASMTFGDLKKKLELIVGAEAEKISVKLLDSEGTMISTLSGDNQTLNDLGVKSGMRFFAEDTSKFNEALKDDSMVEKYEISEEAYDKREHSVRAWKKKYMPYRTQDENDYERACAEAAKLCKVGDRCEVNVKYQPPRRGTISYVGYVNFRPGAWIGVIYDEPVGKNDGEVEGHRYFTSEMKYGGFVRPVDVIRGEFSELEIESTIDEL